MREINLNTNIRIKDLVIIDIDTLIYYQLYFKKKDKNFKNSLNDHIKKMNSNYEGYGKTKEEYRNNMMIKLEKKLLPYSFRLERLAFNDIDYSEIKEFINVFSNMILSNHHIEIDYLKLI